MQKRSNFRQLTGISALLILLAIVAVSNSGAQAKILLLPTGIAPTAPAEGTQTLAGGCRASLQPASIAASAVSSATQSATMDMTAISATQATGSAATKQSGTPSPTPQVYTASGCALMGALDGTSEVLTPGPEDASGAVVLSVDSKLGQLCFDLQVSGITLPASAADIHKGDEGATGPIVAKLTPPDKTGRAAGCVNNLDITMLADLAVHAESYYVNVINSDFPQGAVRGNVGPSARITSSQAVPPINGIHIVGAASIDGDASTGSLCYYVRVFGGINARSGSLILIHKGKTGEVGPSVVPLLPLNADDVSQNCTSADPVVVADMLANPDNYYIAIYTTGHTPDTGPVARGQLGGGS